MPLDAPVDSGGFSFVNLAILIAVAIVVVPAYLKLRARISRSRKERWAREDAAYQAAVEAQDRQDGTERSV